MERYVSSEAQPGFSHAPIIQWVLVSDNHRWSARWRRTRRPPQTGWISLTWPFPTTEVEPPSVRKGRFGGMEDYSIQLYTDWRALHEYVNFVHDPEKQ